MAKGSAFERSVCKELSLWWSKGKNDDLFWRTAGSGARATTRAKSGKKTKAGAGDIFATDPSSKTFTDVFALELKRGYTRETFAELIDKPEKAKKQTYDQWITQATKSKKVGNSLYWMIIHQRNRREAIVVLPYNFVFDNFPNVEGKGSSAIVHYINKKGNYRSLFVCPLKDFLKSFTPEMIKDVFNERSRDQ